MKKRVEAELISIAHRILKLKNKSEIDQLYKETQKLYEALTILKFYGDNYEMLKNSIPVEEIEEKVAAFIESNEVITPVAVAVKKEPEVDVLEETIIPTAKKIEEEPVVVGEIIIEEEEEIEEEIEASAEPIVEETEEESFMPSFELSFEEEKEALEETIDKETPSKQVTMDDVFGDHFKEPVFVKPEDNVQGKFVKVFEEKNVEEAGRVLSLNDTLSNSISIGLNDRIGFVKHLFNESNEDYNRVLSQLNTFDTFDEAKTFLNEMVIPDYNYWVGKEEYLERFMEIVEKKFK
ncbi:MAG TPA: hypothetical protein PK218_00720 [Flavobacterium sp.]|jgi:hypothetical protein|uniref:hypothetical protein n=1 Tax=Flavobacterium sp. TaxID=239 RepID=UPI002B6986FF|nr:hypothetical protein [Flavobacterium sp.]MCA0348575.1 hypothetical protein [Bacteroidota bacterium]HPW97064.1 hypothetical protein [Flavobacterium sp.]HQA73262.1 hypothetical protein [Flavobacterium sp.]